ncbi:MAG: MFS transporter [Candidatus Parvarchaeota archaeon]|nr:MFS transporter [Candidatus Parvarchaeum tengchongense]MCW1298945.1 MFS transporter [Candidatus Parvarchaeum tengchongense]MCW1312015.1 MFS transporter [Candidatus Parvarchaeum tengchongense]
MQSFSRKRALLFTSLTHFANDGNFLLFSILIVFFSKLPGVSIAFLGVNAILYNVLYGVISLPIGEFSDRLNNDRLLLAFGIALEGLAAFFFGLGFIYTGYYIIFVVLGSVALGSGQAFYHPIGASVLSFVYESKDLGKILGINGAFGSLGRALMPSVITFLLLFFGSFRGMEVLAVYVWILSMIIYFGMSGFTRPYKKHKKIKKKKYLPEGIKRSLYSALVPIFLKGAFIMGTVTFIAEYLDKITGSVAFTGIILTISFIPAILGQPIFGYITTIKGGRFTITLTSVFSLLAFILFLATTNVVIITFAYAVLAFLIFTGFSVLLDYTYQLVPKEYYSTAYGLVWGAGNILGGAFGIALMTYFLTFTNIIIAMYYMAGLLLISIIFLPLLPRPRKSRLLT